MARTNLPIPSHFNPSTIDKVWPVPYSARQDEALNWARKHGISPSANDRTRVALMIIDAQNTLSLIHI